MKTQCDVKLAGVSSNEPLAVRVITVAVIAISDDAPGSSEDLAMAVASVRWLGSHWARQATCQQKWHQQRPGPAGQQQPDGHGLAHFGHQTAAPGSDQQ